MSTTIAKLKNWHFAHFENR